MSLSKLGLAAILTTASLGATAQEPQRTTATFSDWTLRCGLTDSGKSKNCDVIQSASVQGQATPISELAHGFRASASTILNERDYNRDVIGAVLGHQGEDEIRRAYNRAKYWPERIKLMQEWAELLDVLRVLG